MIPLGPESIVYILAPANSVSGGQEALHQLAFYLGKKGCTTRIAYYYQGRRPQNPVSDRYRQYGTAWCCYEDVVDEPQHLLICPEIAPWLLARFRKIRKAIWWLSVGFFAATERNISFRTIASLTLSGRLRDAQRRLARRVALAAVMRDRLVHFAGSHYAQDYVRRRFGLTAHLLIEPLGLDFINSVAKDGAVSLDSRMRDNVVLYNPAKGNRLMQQLMLRHPEHVYVPLRGYSSDQLITLMRKSRLYVDFGKFPGPERLPKEAVACGCCVLTARDGAAAFYQDVRVPEEFKIRGTDVGVINEKLTELLEHYDAHIAKYEDYRQMVAGLETQFNSQLDGLFPLQA